MSDKNTPEGLEITRAVWDGLPSKDKRTWKDGTRLVRQKNGGDSQWVRVFWKR